ncbi:peptidase domain-containing ABC transporter [Undibacterium sp. Di27W]|uniref:peptidase domain-containing ABC transporter n=1 Tax=Undibacterium sp. Di27W TaxID=3413036 RepID=UPI003BF12350
MNFLNALSFGLGKKLPLLLQTELTECGLACLGMIAGYHGYRTDLATLRHDFPISLKGATLPQLIQTAQAIGLQSRPLKVELEGLESLNLPCILHWNFNHFVVLHSVKSGIATIYDPAMGIRKLSLNEVSTSFTGVVLEIWPGRDFQPRLHQQQKISLQQLFGTVRGLTRSLTQILLLALTLEVFSIIGPFFLQWVIDKVVLSADPDLLLTLALGFWLVMILQQVTMAVRSWVIMYMSTTLNLQWRANVFAHLLRLPVQYFEKRHIGDVVSRFSSVDVIQHTLTTSFVEAILDGLMALFTVVMMFLYSPVLGMIAVVTTLLYALSRWAWYQPLKTATEEQIIHAAKQSSHFLETVRGVKTVKLFQRQDMRRVSWLSLLVDQINADLRTQKIQIFFKLTNGLLFGTENILIIGLGAKMVLDGQFTVGVLTAFIAFKTLFDTRVSSLIDKTYEFKMLQVQTERVGDIVMSEPEAFSQQIIQNEHATKAPTLEVTGLRFRYSEHEPYVLDDINFKIESGESVAIRGSSGCGKSTLLNVLLGVLPLSEGDVLIDGVSIKRLGIEGLRQMVGVVMQDDVLFAGSVADNICFFDANPDQDWIEECARMAAVAEEINAMPMRYSSLVGDMGTILSGGQKQRILLARAFYKRPRILFLDEATSHLDVFNERRVNNAVGQLQITRVIVAHRQETLATADRVISLAVGKMVTNDVNQIHREPVLHSEQV